jgi:diacylglycerol kinase family enzyme
LTGKRIAAFLALALGCAALALAASTAVRSFPLGLAVLGCIALALACGWHGLVRRGAARAFGLGGAAALAATAVVLLVSRDTVALVLTVIALWLALAAARTAFRMHIDLPAAPPPRRPVLFFNPRSGDGKAARFDVAAAARARGIEAIELTPGADLVALARRAVADGADALAMAGGDGSQAAVAAIAAEHELPYACVPAGTRNHFALDLGVDREDIVGALDAFVDGGERVVDLADVNGRIFVNNVSLGLYAQAVQRPGYREAKLRTLLDVVPDVLGPDSQGLDLHWRGPRGREHSAGAAILVSNNRYRLGRAVGSGTRPQIDDGLLGITVFGAPRAPRPRGASGRQAQRPWREWTAPAFEVDSDRPVPAGIDGEATRLEPPLRFTIHPGVLRVRIARAHPGASPSAMQPQGGWEGVRALAALVAGHDPRRPLAGPPAAHVLKPPANAPGPRGPGPNAPGAVTEHRSRS